MLFLRSLGSEYGWCLVVWFFWFYDEIGYRWIDLHRVLLTLAERIQKESWWSTCGAERVGGFVDVRNGLLCELCNLHPIDESVPFLETTQTWINNWMGQWQSYQTINKLSPLFVCVFLPNLMNSADVVWPISLPTLFDYPCDFFESEVFSNLKFVLKTNYCCPSAYSM